MKNDWHELWRHHFARALFARDDWQKAIKDGRNRFVIRGMADARRMHIKYALMARKAARA